MPLYAPLLTKPREKKRQPTPEELGFLDEAPPPPAPEAKRQPTPEELGFEDAPEMPVGPVTQPSPEDLGLAKKPMGAPPPADDSWESWWNWAQDKVEPVAQEAGEAAEWLWQNVKDLSGYEETKKKQWEQDTSRRVEHPDMTKDSGLFDTVVDWLVPDLLYDFATSKRTQKNLDIGWDMAQYAFGDAMKGGTYVLKKADEALRAVGLDLDYWDRSDEEREATWQGTIKFLDEIQQEYGKDLQRKSGEFQKEFGERELGDALVQVVPSLPTMLAEYGLAGAVLGPVGGFAFIDGMTKAGGGGTPDEVLFAAVKGATLGKLLEWANVLSRPLRVVPLAGAGAGLAYSEGADTVDVMANAIVFPVLGIMPKGGPVGVRYLREHGVMPDIRDIGGHVRDLFIGGNEPMAKRDFETAGWALKQIRAKHNIEQTTEMQMWQDELAAARKPQPGDTETSVQDRVAEANARHEIRLEEQSKKQFEEELPFRQAHDHAERRYRRAQHPIRVTWKEAPYMRSLHMYERDVVTTNIQAMGALQKLYEENSQRAIDGKARADEMRRQAEQEPDEVARRRMNQMADHIENETFRITFERRVNAEDAAEFAIELAEMRAANARYEMARMIEQHNKVEGRRAMQMATERDVADAYRAGLRKIARGNRRARELLQKGDEIVVQQEQRLKRDGITEDNPETQAVWQRQMEQANEIRDQYRGMASLSLWENQTAADMRITFAHAAWDVAHNPQPKPGMVDRILEILGLRKPREPMEPDLSKPGLERFRKNETRPEDAKKEDPPDWDPRPKEDPVKPNKNFEQRYKALMEHSKKDPKLGKIQDQVDHALAKVTRPEDVLPMINFVAKQNQYDPPSRRGIQTAKLRRQAAEKLGMTSDEFLNSPYGKAFSDFELEAIIMILDRQWARTQHAYKLWRQTGSNNAFMAYQAELYRFMMIWERLRGAAAESGRSLRMFRDVKKKYGSATRPLSDLEYKMIMNGDGTQAMRMMEKYKKSGFMGMLMEYYINNLLSGPQTAMVNIYSGASMLVIESILKPAIAASVGLTRYAFHQMIGRFLIPPFRAVYRAGVRAFGSEMANRKLDIKIENERWTPAGTEAMNAHAHRIRLGEVGARVRGLLEGLPAATVQFFRTLFLGEKFLGETNWAAGYGEHIPWWLGGSIIRIPGKILGAIDDFFKVLMYRSSIRGHAYRLAMAEYNYSSQQWKDMRGRRARYNELVKNPQGYVEGMARNEALRVTFQQTPDPMWGGIPETIASTPMLRILVPFTKTLLNSLEWVLSGTPMGAFLFRSSREALLGRRGRAAQDLAIAHVMLVTGASTAVFMWALGDDNVMPPYPKDEKGKVIAGINNAPPLSVRLPGTDEYIQLNRVDPIGAIISLGSAAAHAYKMSMQKGDTKKAQQSWEIFLASMFSMVADRSGFRGLLDFLTAAQGGTAGNQPDAWANWANKLGGTLAVPNVIASWARTRDPVIRSARTLMEQINSRIPGEREKLPPVRNLWGDMVIGYDSYGENDILDYTQPIYWGKRATDPATKMMLDLHKIYGWAPGFLDRSIAGRELTPEEYDYYQVQRGKYAYPGIRKIAESPEYKEVVQLRDEVKRIRAEIGKMERSSNASVEVRKKIRELKRELKDKSERLQKQSYKILQLAKDVFRGANAQARSDTAGNSDQSRPGMFPDIWKRPKRRDDFSNPGEVPEYDMFDWLDSWMHADGPQSETQEWEAEEAKASEEYDGNPYTGGDPVSNRARAQHQRWQEANRKWIEDTRRIQAINADRMKRGLPPLPLPPKPEPVQ